MTESGVASIKIDDGETRILGFTPPQLIKGIVGLFVVAILIQVFGAFAGAKKSPILQDFTETFGNIASAAVWASSHWYLILAGFMLAPLLPAATKWAVDKASKGLKEGAKLSDASKKGILDAITYEAKVDAASKETDPERRKELTEKAEAAREEYNKQSDEDKEATEKALEDIDVKPPPAEK